MFSHRVYKGYNIWWYPERRETTIVVLNKVLKVIKNRPKLIGQCHAKIWIRRQSLF